jgi:hypothetical protein
LNNLRSYGHLAYSDNKCIKQLLYALDDHVWGIKITTLKEYSDFAILDIEFFLASLSFMNYLAKVILIRM